MSTSTKITAALTGKTTGLTARELIEATGVTKSNAVSSNLFNLVKRGVVLKHAGETRQTSRYSLNPEQIPDTPSTRKVVKKKKTSSAGKKNKAKRAGRWPTSTPPPVADIERDFIPAMTVDQELVVVEQRTGRVRVYPAEQTQQIATLIFANFNAG